MQRSALTGRRLWLILAVVAGLALMACGDDDGAVVADEPSEDGSGGDEAVDPDAEGDDDVVSSDGQPTDEGTGDDDLVLETPADADDYVGLTKDDAEAKAEADGREARIVSVDGEAIPATDDYRPNRINLTIEDGDVTAAEYG